MFDADSRYAAIENSSLAVTLTDGTTRTIVYKHRRFLPPPDAGTTVADHRVTAGDRLDLLAHRYLGDATAFWRLCDANAILRPAELTAEVGSTIRIAIPDVGP